MRIAGESPKLELPITAAAPEGRAAPSGRTPEASFARALRRAGQAVDGGERLMADASRGNLGGLDSAQLIALQAGIYRYSEAVDLLAKLVDRAATAVKTVVSPH
jgi:hypothetical protein